MWRANVCIATYLGFIVFVVDHIICNYDFGHFTLQSKNKNWLLLHGLFKGLLRRWYLMHVQLQEQIEPQLLQKFCLKCIIHF